MLESNRSGGEARGRGRAIERSVARLSERLRDALLVESWAHRPGILQRLDPRGKIVGIVGLVLLVSTNRAEYREHLDIPVARLRKEL